MVGMLLTRVSNGSTIMKTMTQVGTRATSHLGECCHKINIIAPALELRLKHISAEATSVEFALVFLQLVQLLAARWGSTALWDRRIQPDHGRNRELPQWLVGLFMVSAGKIFTASSVLIRSDTTHTGSF